MKYDNVVHHQNLCGELNHIYECKNHDYGDSFHETFLEEGLAMSRIRLSDKLSRFKKLSRLDSSDYDEQKVKMEREEMRYNGNTQFPNPTSFESGIEN